MILILCCITVSIKHVWTCGSFNQRAKSMNIQRENIKRVTPVA